MMKCLSFKEPWLWLMLENIKDVENRNWVTRYRGPLLLHASKTWDIEGEQWIRAKLRNLGIVLPGGLPNRNDSRIRLGAIVGKGDLVDCVSWFRSPWFFGQYGFLLKNLRRLAPIPYRGELGLFNVPDKRGER